MAVMANGDRIVAAREFIRRVHEELHETATSNTIDIKAAIDAADAWADSNASSFNSALPVAFRTAANLKQKTFLLAYVIFKRADII